MHHHTYSLVQRLHWWLIGGATGGGLLGCSVGLFFIRTILGKIASDGWQRFYEGFKGAQNAARRHEPIGNGNGNATARAGHELAQAVEHLLGPLNDRIEDLEAAISELRAANKICIDRNQELEAVNRSLVTERDTKRVGYEQDLKAKQAEIDNLKAAISNAIGGKPS
jgi:hypothetical protein